MVSIFKAFLSIYHELYSTRQNIDKLFSFSRPGYTFVRNDTGFIGSVYKKARYVRYTDASFSTPFPYTDPELDHLGLLGPVIAGEVGDTLRVTFRNNAQYPFSIHPQVILKNNNRILSVGIAEGARLNS
jgi:hypothetical protein